MASTILESTLPANLYPLTWLLPSGNLLIQSNWATSILDYKNVIETPIDDMPDAVRVYPASAGTAMLPLTPANNYTATILFCGGSDVQPNQYVSHFFGGVQFNEPSVVQVAFAELHTAHLPRLDVMRQADARYLWLLC